jgi:lysine-ketoglutarate reductase/saccharopine dehydrogenase-like protein (TIGR00300 family)
MDRSGSQRHSRVVELRGHIIDSLMLPRIMDELMGLGVEYEIQQLDVGQHKTDSSYARIEIIAPSADLLETAVIQARAHGAAPLEEADAVFAPAPADGVFPEHFYATTNLETHVLVEGVWTPVRYPEMDCGVVRRELGPECLPLAEVRAGEPTLLAGNGVRVVPVERPRQATPIFGFMGSTVSSEKPKAMVIRQVADWIRQARAGGQKVLIVGGPAVVHTGAREQFIDLVRRGHVDYVFAGNALAVHDIEIDFFGTSLGVPLDGSPPLESGHEHHLRAINRIRGLGGIRQAVEAGVLKGGIMHACVESGVDVVLAGSIRDDGPLPEVITDVIEAQRVMRAKVREGVGVALMLSTMLHSIAVGNLLPASVATVCVDINPSVLTKLMDRGSFQTVGLVMDVGSFLRDLCDALAVRVDPPA